MLCICSGLLALGIGGVVDYVLGIWVIGVVHLLRPADVGDYWRCGLWGIEAIGVVHLLKPADVGDWWRCGLCFGDMGDRCCALAQAC